MKPTTVVNVSTGGGEALAAALVGVVALGTVGAIAAALAAMVAALVSLLITIVCCGAAVACTGLVCWAAVRRAQIHAEVTMAREAQQALARRAPLVIDAARDLPARRP